MSIEIEICTCDETLGASDLAEGTFLSGKDLANVFFDAAARHLEKSGLFDNAEIIPAKGQRMLHHGWRGASWFGGYNAGGIATFAKLNSRRRGAMDAAAEAAQIEMERVAEDSKLD